MPVLVLVFFLGCVDGLRSMTAPAVVCWAAHFGWLHFQGTRLAFIDRPFTFIIFTVLAIGELIADKLPKTPARIAFLPLIARVVIGALCGFALAVTAGVDGWFGAMVAAAGAVAGAFAGYNIRKRLVTRAHLPDFFVAIAEDAIAIAAGLFIVSRV
jgi:uncharacterized membrane protein